MHVFLIERDAFRRFALLRMLGAVAGVAHVSCVDESDLSARPSSYGECDLLILGMSHDRMDGWKVLEDACRVLSARQVMLMSDSPLPSEPSPALAQAVSIWLPRSAPIPLVEQAVRRLAGRDDAMVSHSPMPEPSAVLAPPPPASLRSNEAELLNLSQRQYEVLLLLSYGHPLKKVASLLQISVATVKSHTRTVYQALGVHSKSEAIYAARQAGAMLCWGCARDSQPRWQAGYDAWSDEASGEEPRIVSDPEEEESRLPLVWQRTAMA